MKRIYNINWINSTRVVLLIIGLGIILFANNSHAQDCELKIEILEQNSACGDIDSGSAMIGISGGQSPFTISWRGNKVIKREKGRSVSGLPAGSYSVSVTDAGGCKAEQRFSVSKRERPRVSVKNDENGTLVLQINGNGPYDIRWFKDQEKLNANGRQLTGATSGRYIYFVFDQQGCFTANAIMVE